MTPWIGFDVDATLAHFDLDTYRPGVVGPAIPRMLARLRQHLQAGHSVRLFTARVAPGNPGELESRAALKQWCLENVGLDLPVTATKDYGMLAHYDDRAVQVEPNTGVPITEALAQRLLRRPPLIRHPAYNQGYRDAMLDLISLAKATEVHEWSSGSTKSGSATSG